MLTSATTNQQMQKAALHEAPDIPHGLDALSFGRIHFYKKVASKSYQIGRLGPIFGCQQLAQNDDFSAECEIEFRIVSSGPSGQVGSAGRNMFELLSIASSGSKTFRLFNWMWFPTPTHWAVGPMAHGFPSTF